MGVPVWEHDGIICTGESYKSVVKLTFAKGASLKDPSGLFNSSLEGNPLWSMTDIRRPAATVIVVVTVAITAAAVLGVPARAINMSSRRSTRFSLSIRADSE